MKEDSCLQQEKSIADTALYVYRQYRRKDLILETAKEKHCPFVEEPVKKNTVLFAKWKKWGILSLVKEGTI
jgi:hypothetical protein